PRGTAISTGDWGLRRMRRGADDSMLEPAWMLCQVLDVDGDKSSVQHPHATPATINTRNALAEFARGAAVGSPAEGPVSRNARTLARKLSSSTLTRRQPTSIVMPRSALVLAAALFLAGHWGLHSRPMGL